MGDEYGWEVLMSESGNTSTDGTDTDSVNRLFTGLSSEYRRLVVAYFMETDTEIASIAELAEYVRAEQCDDEHTSRERITIQLHHVAVPKLAATGVLDYDPRTKTVRYHGESTLEDIQDYLSTIDS